MVLSTQIVGRLAPYICTTLKLLVARLSMNGGPLQPSVRTLFRWSPASHQLSYPSPGSDNPFAMSWRPPTSIRSTFDGLLQKDLSEPCCSSPFENQIVISGIPVILFRLQTAPLIQTQSVAKGAHEINIMHVAFDYSAQADRIART